MKLHQLPNNDREAYFALAHICEPADDIINRALSSHSPLAVLELLLAGRIKPLSRPRIRAAYSDFCLEKEIDFSASIGARFITRGETGWPQQLDCLDDETPWVLWSLGGADFRVLSLQSLAIVGARSCTPYGRNVAHTWASDLSRRGLTIVSGGAIGIDVSAHMGALQAGEPTLCVLAGGVQARYPASNEHVFSKILDCGAILSESPPRQEPRRQRFLTRNRLIAALTLGTVVVEASTRSGTESTATRAHHMNRTVMGVPGSIHSSQSEGVHNLIAQGVASLVASPQDVLQVMKIEEREETQKSESQDWRTLTQCELDVWEALPQRGGCLPADLVGKAHRSLPEVLSCLTELELKDMATSDGFLWRRT
jgi:DNA processing protein